jgi:hypothetical protein
MKMKKSVPIVRLSIFFVRQVQISSFFSLRVRDSEVLGFCRSELLVSRALLRTPANEDIVKLLSHQIMLLLWFFVLLFTFYSN